MSKTVPVRIDSELYSALSKLAQESQESISTIIAKSLNGMKPYREYNLKFSIDFANKLDIICKELQINPSEYIENNLNIVGHPSDSYDSFELPDFM